ncbi:MAG: MFS transporter [Cyanobacteriota bacterium]
MANTLLSFFKAPPDAIEKVSEDKIPSVYKHWRIRMFYSMFIAYAVFYMCRKNISVALPGMNEDLGYSFTELGILGSTLYITYAIGKFVNGVIADRSNIRTFLSIGLLVSAVINIIFGFASAFWLLAFLWGLNGWIQSMGFPPVAKGLTHWFGQKERATKWSIWSTSHGVGTTIAVWLSGVIVAYLSWQYVFIIPGVVAILGAIFIYNRTRDTPKSLGLPSIEEFKNEPIIAAKADKEIEKESFVQTFIKHILPNKVLWGLSIIYIFVYIIRYGTLDWMFVFYMQFKGYDEVKAAFILGILPIASIVGTIAAGYASDKFFNSKRMPLNFISLIILGIATWLLLLIPGNNLVIDLLLIIIIGVFNYIPQVLVGGVCAVESGSKKVASAATGFTGMFGYLGTAIAGPLTGFLLDSYGWVHIVYFWVISAAIGAIICLAMIKDEAKRLNAVSE